MPKGFPLEPQGGFATVSDQKEAQSIHGTNDEDVCILKGVQGASFPVVNSYREALSVLNGLKKLPVVVAISECHDVLELELPYELLLLVVVRSLRVQFDRLFHYSLKLVSGSAKGVCSDDPYVDQVLQREKGLSNTGDKSTSTR